MLAAVILLVAQAVAPADAGAWRAVFEGKDGITAVRPVSDFPGIDLARPLWRCPRLAPLPATDVTSFNLQIDAGAGRRTDIDVLISELPPGTDAFQRVRAVGEGGLRDDLTCSLTKRGISFIQVGPYWIGLPTFCSKTHYRAAVAVVLRALKRAFPHDFPKEFIFAPCGMMRVEVSQTDSFVEAAPARTPAVLFVQGHAEPGDDRTLLLPIACYKPDAGLVSAAATDCLSLMPKAAQVALDSGTIIDVAGGRGTAVCINDTGKPTGESRRSLAVSHQEQPFAYAVWPVSARSLIRPLCHSPFSCQPGKVPPRELNTVDAIVRRHARGEREILQRFEGDLDGDGQPDVAYSVDVRCTGKEMRARGGPEGWEEWSCFNGLLVRWGGSTTFDIVARGEGGACSGWDLGRIAAISDFDGDQRPEVLVFAPLDEGERIQLFTVDNRQLRPLEPWCCGCKAQSQAKCRPAKR